MCSLQGTAGCLNVNFDTIVLGEKGQKPHWNAVFAGIHTVGAALENIFQRGWSRRIGSLCVLKPSKTHTQAKSFSVSIYSIILSSEMDPICVESIIFSFLNLSIAYTKSIKLIFFAIL